jgi:C-terminal processing protease CtpA/Prc
MARFLLVLVCATLIAPDQTESTSPALAEILTFEAPHSSACPAGWGCHPRETAAVDSEVVHGGKWSVRIERLAGSPEPFSAVNSSIPIDRGGSTIELRGFVRTEDVGEASYFWMREDGPGGGVGFASGKGNHSAKGTTPWTEYSISLPLEPDARSLVFGFILEGTGKAWADDLRLLVDGKPVWDAPSVARPITPLDTDRQFDSGSHIALNDLTKIQIENLTNLGKVWGFLKYHHPQVTSGKRHFDYDLLRILPVILAAPNRSLGNAALVRWIEKLGDVGTCKACAELDEHDLYLRPELDWITDESYLGADLSRSLRRIRDNRPADGRQFYISLAPNIQNPVFEHELAYNNVGLPDAGFQILALYRFWNLTEYWFPYRNAIGEDWNVVLTEFLPRVALARDRSAYQREMMALVARIHDTHAFLFNSLPVQPPGGFCFVPANVRFVESQAVVTGYSNADLGTATGLKLGDVIEAVDGRDVPGLVRDWTPYYSGSNEQAILRDIGRSITRGDCARPAVLRVRRESETFELTAPRVPWDTLDVMSFQNHDLSGDTFRLLSKDIAYLKLSSVKSAEVVHYIESAAGTRGLIIDIRNYPSEFVAYSLGQLLVDRPTTFVRFTRGDLTNPGAFHWSAPESLAPQKPHYAGLVVILVDEASQSQSEFTAMAFRSVPGALVVGSTTAGADGNPSEISLPCTLMRTQFSGIGVFYPDKKPTQRIGIIPDVEVKPTMAGIRAGRDEVLEAALRQIQ